MPDTLIMSSMPSVFSPLAKALLDGFSEGVVVFDAEGRLLYANQPARLAMDGLDLSEMATPGHKGFYTAWQSASQQVAIVLAAALGFALNELLSPAVLADWGWRIPFFVGCMIIPCIFVLRRSLQETEAFQARKHHPTTREVFQSMARNWRVVLCGMLLVAMTTTPST